MNVAKSFEHESVEVLNQYVKDNAVVEKPLSANEREEIIHYVISTQRIEGIEVDYDMAAAMVDKAYERPLSSWDSI